jgi:hypothetical protein
MKKSKPLDFETRLVVRESGQHAAPGEGSSKWS